MTDTPDTAREVHPFQMGSLHDDSPMRLDLDLTPTTYVFANDQEIVTDMAEDEDTDNDSIEGNPQITTDTTHSDTPDTTHSDTPDTATPAQANTGTQAKTLKGPASKT